MEIGIELILVIIFSILSLFSAAALIVFVQDCDKRLAKVEDDILNCSTTRVTYGALEKRLADKVSFNTYDALLHRVNHLSSDIERIREDVCDMRIGSDIADDSMHNYQLHFDEQIKDLKQMLDNLTEVHKRVKNDVDCLLINEFCNDAILRSHQRRIDVLLKRGENKNV